MRNLRGYLLVEWKLLFRGPLFWICCLMCGGVFYLFSMDNQYQNNLGHNAMDQSKFLMVVFLTGLLLSMHAARRDYAARSHLLHGALPVRLWQLHASRVIGVALPLSAIALIPAGSFVAALLKEGIPLNEGGTGIMALSSSVIPVWLVVVAGYMLSGITNKRWIYLVGLAGFIAATYLLQSLILLLRLPYNWIQLFDFTQLDLFYDGWYSTQWGFMQDSSFWLHRTSHLGFLLVLFFAFVIAGMLRRKERQGLSRLYAAAGATLLLTFVSVYAYTHISLGKMTIVREELDFYRPTYEVTYYDMSGKVIESDARRLEKERTAQYQGLAAKRFDLTLNAKNNHRLSVDATVEIVNGTSNALERFPVTLRHSFGIDSLSVDGERAEYEWEPNRDFLWVKLAKPLAQGVAAKVDIAYSGEVNDWRYEISFQNGKYLRAAFVDEDRILLPGTYGWFPMPGIYKLTVFEKRFSAAYKGGTSENEVLSDPNFALPNADYNVTFISDKPIDLLPAVGTVVRSERKDGGYETHLQAENASGFSLVAGPLRLITHKSGDISLSMIVDRWWAGGETEQSLAALTIQTDLVMRLLNELWPKPKSEPGMTGRDFPQTLTLMSDDKRYRFWTPESIFEPPIANADGMAYLTDAMDMALNHSYFRKNWVEKLLEHYFEKPVFDSTNFTLLLTAYIDALAEPNRDKPLFPFSQNGAYWYTTPYETQFNELYSKLPAEKFKQFLKGYYELVGDESLTYDVLQKKESEFVAGWAEESR